LILGGLQDRAKLNCLEILNLSNNKITELTHIALPALKKLNLNDNQIKDCSAFKGHYGLEILEIRRNKIPSLQGLG
jgi:Leucine-rich repeat (LRR) protein